MITFWCPSCSKAYSVPDDRAGRRGKCSRCGEPLVCPAAPPKRASVTPPKPAPHRKPWLTPKRYLACFAGILAAVLLLAYLIDLVTRPPAYAPSQPVVSFTPPPPEPDPREQIIAEARKSFPAVAARFHGELARALANNTNRIYLGDVRLGDAEPFPFYANQKARMDAKYSQWVEGSGDPNHDAIGVASATIWVNDGIPGVNLPDHPEFFEFRFGYRDGRWTFISYRNKYR